MAKKTAEAVNPSITLFQNWWVRAAVSFVAGIFFAVLTEMVYGTYFSFLTGVAAFTLTIVVPITFVVQAIKHEGNWRKS